MDGVSPGLDLARRALGTTQVQPVGIERIAEVVARHYNVTLEDLMSPRRNQEIAYPRHLACYLCREMTGSSFPHIGTFFDRDHSTIMHSVRSIKKLLETDDKVAAEITYLRGRIASGLV